MQMLMLSPKSTFIPDWRNLFDEGDDLCGDDYDDRRREGGAQERSYTSLGPAIHAVFPWIVMCGLSNSADTSPFL